MNTFLEEKIVDDVLDVIEDAILNESERGIRAAVAAAARIAVHSHNYRGTRTVTSLLQPEPRASPLRSATGL